MKIKILSLAVSAILMLTACGTNVGSNNSSTPDSSSESETTTAETSETTVETTETQPALVLPSTTNDSGKVMIQTVSKSSAYPFNSYIITSSNGESVVVDPTEMPGKDIVDINPAAIISTHSHEDHTDAKFSDSYDCPKIMYTKEDIKTKDFHIYTIWSQHDQNAPVAENSGNVIVVFEVDGLRIAHMGDIGQAEITPEQLEQLGKIDIAFMQLSNTYSSMNLTNKKGFKLLEQFNPTVVIPTHHSDSAYPIIEKKYGKVTMFDNALTISKEDLPQAPMNFYHISNTHKYN